MLYICVILPQMCTLSFWTYHLVCLLNRCPVCRPTLWLFQYKILATCLCTCSTFFQARSPLACFFSYFFLPFSTWFVFLLPHPEWPDIDVAIPGIYTLLLVLSVEKIPSSHLLRTVPTFLEICWPGSAVLIHRWCWPCFPVRTMKLNKNAHVYVKTFHSCRGFM